MTIFPLLFWRVACLRQPRWCVRATPADDLADTARSGPVRIWEARIKNSLYILPNTLMNVNLNVYVC